jgi:succinate-semialdehyde dehydrogenase/glutarate-semialdehyde dehydrogenase
MSRTRASTAASAAGGHRIGDKGNFYEPTVVTELATDAKAMNDEPFGPMAIINPFKTFDDAVTEANRLPYGLPPTRGPIGEDGERHRIAVETGMITINHLGWRCPKCRSAASRIRATDRKAAARRSSRI